MGKFEWVPYFAKKKKKRNCFVQIMTMSNSLRYAIWNLHKIENIKLTTTFIIK